MQGLSGLARIKKINLYKSKLNITLIIILILFLFRFEFVYAQMPDISAHSAIVIDADTSRILYEKNPYEILPMASTTKIMTAILALENGNPDDIVTVGDNAVGIEGSSIWLQPGEKQKLEDLVYGIMLSSGNDAAVAIAEHIGGTIEQFVEMMNQKAKEIGALNTSFKNPNGLPADGHYTTAYDLAVITAYAFKNKKFTEIVRTKEKKIPWQESKWGRLLQNHNKLLDMYEGCDGVKTGFTKEAGRCLVSSATRNGWRAISVTLNAPNDWQDHSKMFDKAFENYHVYTVINKDDYIKTIPVLNGKKDKIQLSAQSDINIVIRKDKTDKVNTEYNLPDYIEAPVRYGQIIGSVSILINDKEYKKVNLMSDEGIEEIGLNITLGKILKNWMLQVTERIII